MFIFDQVFVHSNLFFKEIHATSAKNDLEARDILLFVLFIHKMRHANFLNILSVNMNMDMEVYSSYIFRTKL